MSSIQRNLIRTPTTSATRRRSLRRRLNKPRNHRLSSSSKPFKNVVAADENKACQNVGVLEKLEALKNLIPSKTGEVKADQLFEETADYIVFLRTQVEILQRLVDFYGSSSSSTASSTTTSDNNSNNRKVV